MGSNRLESKTKKRGMLRDILTCVLLRARTAPEYEVVSWYTMKATSLYDEDVDR